MVRDHDRTVVATVRALQQLQSVEDGKIAIGAALVLVQLHFAATGQNEIAAELDKVIQGS